MVKVVKFSVGVTRDVRLFSSNFLALALKASGHTLLLIHVATHGLDGALDALDRARRNRARQVHDELDDRLCVLLRHLAVNERAEILFSLAGVADLHADVHEPAEVDVLEVLLSANLVQFTHAVNDLRC